MAFVVVVFCLFRLPLKQLNPQNPGNILLFSSLPSHLTSNWALGRSIQYSPSVPAEEPSLGS